MVEPKIINPIPVDNPSKGAPSDFTEVLVEPLSNLEEARGTVKEIEHVCLMPESFIEVYSISLGRIDWSLMIDGISSSTMVDTFQKMITDLVEIHFPFKKISPCDKPWITEELKALRRRRQRTYRKDERSQT